MGTVRFEISDDILVALRETPEGLTSCVRTEAAAALFRSRRLSLGKASELAGMSRPDFIDWLGSRHISPWNLTDEEWNREIREAQVRAEQ